MTVRTPAGDSVLSRLGYCSMTKVDRPKVTLPKAFHWVVNVTSPISLSDSETEVLSVNA
jgi:hypothetical protein